MIRETCICETPMRVADLGLRQVLREAQPQHLALAVGQDAHQALDGGRVLGLAEARVLDAEGGAERPSPLSSSSSRGRSSETAR